MRIDLACTCWIECSSHLIVIRLLPYALSLAGADWRQALFTPGPPCLCRHEFSQIPSHSSFFFQCESELLHKTHVEHIIFPTICNSMSVYLTNDSPECSTNVIWNCWKDWAVGKSLIFYYLHVYKCSSKRQCIVLKNIGASLITWRAMWCV